MELTCEQKFVLLVNIDICAAWRGARLHDKRSEEKNINRDSVASDSVTINY